MSAVMCIFFATPARRTTKAGGENTETQKAINNNSVFQCIQWRQNTLNLTLVDPV